MSNSSYQRAVKDLEAAGLNPALAYQQGGASSPSGSAASGGAASGTAARFDSSAGAGLHSAASVSDFLQSAATQSAQREEIAARADLTQAQAARVRTLTAAELGELQARTKSHSSAASARDTESEDTLQSRPYRLALLGAQHRESLTRGSSAIQAYRESEERTKLFGPQRRLLELQIPTAENIAGAADSWFMKNVAPYLGSAKNAADLLSKPFGR